MTINNKKTAFKIRVRSFFLTLLLTLCIIIFLTSGWFDNPLFGLSKYHYTIIVAGIYLLVGLYNYLLDLNYIFYNDEGDSIIFRFSSLRPLHKIKKSYEIPKSKYMGYQIDKSILGLKKTLILFQYVNNRKAKYPGVSISSLSKKELTKLISSLRKYAKGNT